MSDANEKLKTGIALRLRQAREITGLSQGQVARKLTMHRPTISEIEAGRRKVSAEEIDMFSKLYRISPKWILEGDNSADEGGVDTKILVAARQLSNMKDEDLDKLMATIKMIRKTRKSM